MADFFTSDQTFNGEATCEKAGVRPIFIWWTRGESNPCPKTNSYRLLRAHFVFSNSLCSTPANRLTTQVAFFFMTASKANRLCTFTAE